MKKKHLFLLSTLIVAQSVLPALTASAITADEVDRYKSSWTIEELLAVKPEFDAYAEEQCGTDLYCIDDVRSEHRSAGGLYGAIAAMEINQIVVSEISPSLGKLKIYYMDEYFDYSNNIVTNDRITNFELYWIDEDAMDPSYGYTGKGFYDYSYHINHGTAEANGIHVIAHEYLPEEEDGWFTPYVYREYTFEPTKTFPHNSVYIYAITENGRMQRAYDFSKCVPNLTDINNSCKGEFTSSYYPKYTFTAGEFKEDEPILPDTTPDEIIDDPDNEPDGLGELDNSGETDNSSSPDDSNSSGATDDNTEPITTNDPVAPAQNSTQNAEQNIIATVGKNVKYDYAYTEDSEKSSEKNAVAYENDVKEDDIKTPLGNNAGSSMVEALGSQAVYSNRHEDEFPWWILALLGFGFGVIIIGFATKRRR